MNVETFRHIVCFKSPKFEICSCPLTFCTRECEAHHNGSILIRRPPSLSIRTLPLPGTKPNVPPNSQNIYITRSCALCSPFMLQWPDSYSGYFETFEKSKSDPIPLVCSVMGFLWRGGSCLATKKNCWMDPSLEFRRFSSPGYNRRWGRRVKLAQNWTGKKQKPQKKA